MRRISRRLEVCLAILTSACAWGGTLRGVVADPTRSAIPGTTVHARCTESGVDLTASTDAEGRFTILKAGAGHYRVTVDQPGFEPYRGQPLEVTTDGELTLDIILTLAAQRETVVVTEAASAVETSDTQMGETLGAKALARIPVNGRSFTDLLALQPGVIPMNTRQPNAVVMSGCTNAPPSGDVNPGNLSVSGQRETANGFTVNGSAAQEDFNLGAAVVPNLDAIEDLRVMTSSFDPEHGNFSGGQVLVTTKSGTNTLHGSAFDYVRDTHLDSRNFFASERARYDRQQFGGTIGGAIRKDKLFFFADYQGTRMTQGLETGRISVPSMANRAGDLSDVAASLTGAVNGQYWADRLTRKLGYGVTPGERYYFPGCSTTADCVLPNARVPKNAWAAPAQSLIGSIPQPNQGSNLFASSSQNQLLQDDKAGLRFDANTRWGSLNAYYFADDYRLDNPYPTAQGGANVPGFNALSSGRAQLFTVGLTTALSASTVHEVRLSYLRNANAIGDPVGGVGPSLKSQGFVDANGKPGIVALAPSIEGVENVAFNDFTIGVDLTGVEQANNTIQWSQSLSKVAGNHNMKFGVGLHLDQVNIAPNAMYNGSFLFQGTETGSDFADFLLGIASSYAQGDSHHFYLRNKYIGLYAQDHWRLRPNLTLNYGLRWDLLPPWREKYNQLQTLVLGQKSEVYPGAPEGIVFPGDRGIPSTLAPVRHTNFAPRVGLAWSPDGRTSVRAGFGLFYTAIEGLSAGIMSANPPYGYDYDSFAPPLFETPFITAATGQDVGQRFPSPIPASGASAANPNNSVDWAQYMPITGVPSFFHQNVTPYTESYNFSIQRELARDTVFTASYIGSQAHHLLVLTSANPGDPAKCLALSRPENVMPGTATCGPFGESGTYVTRDGRTVEGTRGPFSSNFAAITLQKTMGNSNYNSLELTLKRSRGSLDMLIGYTYGKSIDQSSSLSEAVNPLNASLSRAPSAFDMRHNVVVSYDWRIPFRGLHGWSISGVSRFATGLPVTLFNNNDTSLLGTIPNGINNDGVDTPDVARGDLAVNTDPRGGKAAFNAALFSLPEIGTVGTAARRMFYGPGVLNFDLSVRKRIQLGESRTLEFRAEAFNAFNHAQFYGAASVNGNISSSGFGEVVSAAAPRQVQLSARFSF